MDVEFVEIKSELIIEDQDNEKISSETLPGTPEVYGNSSSSNFLATDENGQIVSFENCQKLSSSVPNSRGISVKGVKPVEFQGVKSATKSPEKKQGKPSEKVTCNYCQKMYKNVYILKAHIKKFHEEPSENETNELSKERTIPCSQCDKKFTTSSYLKLHQKTHVEKIYKCDVCAKIYQTHGGLRNHKYAHSKKPYSCTICPKSFLQNVTLERHLQFHAKEEERDKKRKFKCEFCPRKFPRTGQLNIHRRIHTGKATKISLT